MATVAEALRSSPVSRPRIAGSIAEIVTAISTVAAVITLARMLVGLVERSSVLPWAIAFLGLTIVRAVAIRVRTVTMASAGDALCRVVRDEVILSMLDDVRPDRDRSPTTIAGPMVDDLDPWLSTYRPARLAAMITPILVALVIVVLDPLTALVLAFAGPMLVALLALIGRVTRDRADRRLGELEWLRELTLDMVRGIPTLRVFGRVDDATSTIRDTSERFGSATMDVLRTAFQTSLVIEWAATAATALVAVEVALRLTDGSLDFATALTVLVLTPEFFAPLRRLASEYHAGRGGDAAIDRIDAALAIGTENHPVDPRPFPAAAVDHPLTQHDRPDHRPPRITIRDVSVAPDPDRPRLVDLDLEIEPGTTIGVIGASGSGKSTLAALIIGSLAPTSGDILIDHQPIGDLYLADWRSRLSLVSQRPYLLSGTIAENIALADPTADRSAIERVAIDAALDEFIETLPDGLDTRVGVEGTRLSGGQRQRIAVARALLRDASVVVLDEFTAHLDPATEHRLIETMRRHLADRTAIVIAHRPATLDLADRVVELRDGRIIDRGAIR